MKNTVKAFLLSDGFYGFCVICPILMDVAFLGVHPYLFLFFTAALLLLTLLRRRKLPVLCLIYLGYALWAAVTRLLYGQWRDIFNMDADFQTVVLRTAEGFCLVCAGTLLSRESRRKLLNWLTFFFCGGMTLMAMLSIYGSVTLRPLVIHGFALVQIEVEDSVAYAQLLYAHRNACAAWFMASLFLLVFQFLTCRKKGWRIPIGLAALMSFVGIALQHSRTVCVAAAGGLGLLVIALCMDRFRGKKPSVLRISVTVLAALVMVAASYKAMSLCADVTNEISRAVTEKQAVQVPQLSASPVPARMEKETAVFTEDNREFLKDLTTLTLRTEVWQAVFKTASRSARSLLLGNPQSNLSSDLVEYGGYDREITHGHNLLVHALYVTGLPGVLLLIAFVACVLAVMLKRFFRSGTGAGEKCLVILLACLLVYAIMEPMLSVFTALSSDLFLLTAGLLKAEERDA